MTTFGRIAPGQRGGLKEGTKVAGRRDAGVRVTLSRRSVTLPCDSGDPEMASKLLHRL